MKFLFLGKPKVWSQLAFDYLQACQVEVSTVPIGTFDVGISYLHPKLIKPEVLRLPRVGFLNFHTAPLPEFRGVAGINFAILEGLREWGVSVHWMDETIDTGAIIEVRKFPINPDKETAQSLDFISQVHLLNLYIETIEKLLHGKIPTGTKQTGGRYISRKDFEYARIIRPGDNVERKRRAFYYPPHEGAVQIHA